MKLMMRRISFALVVMLMVSLFPTRAKLLDNKCSSWSDVSGELSSRVQVVCEAGWMEGYSDGSFGVGKKLSRIEMVSLINKVLDVKLSNNPSSDYENLSLRFEDKFFDEYDSGFDWMYLNLKVALNLRLSGGETMWNGYPDSTFKPLDNVKFVEFLKVVLIANMLDDNLNGNYRLNQYSGDEWFSNYVNFLIAKSVISEDSGLFKVGDVVLSLDESLTRDKAAVILSEILWKGVTYEYKTEALSELELDLPIFMDAVDTSSEVLFRWKSKYDNNDLLSLKLLKSNEIKLPANFVTVYVPTRFVGDVVNLYRSDQCAVDVKQCIRVYWFELSDGRVMILEGSFSDEKTTAGQAAVDNVMRSINFLN